MRPVAVFLGLALTACGAIPGNTPASAQTPASTQPLTPQDRLEAEALVIDVRDGPTLRKAQWTLTPGLNPDIYTVALGDGERREVCFISGARSLCRTVGVGEQHDFIISHAGVDYPTRIVGEYVPPMAVFDEAYQAAHRGKVRVEVPEVYELVNVAIALTPTAREQTWLVARGTPYEQDVLERFAGVSEHPFVLALDRELRRGRYAPVKMNAYAFEFGEHDRVVRSRVYDPTGFSQSTSNDLLPWLSPMQDFADRSAFRAFYAEHRPLYESQIAYLRNQLDLDGMLAWLRANFPDAKPYDTVNIIFSPLVGASQSVTWMESDGFSELQPHVNFPYGPSSGTRSPEAIALRRGWIVFTELNHGFINPTADPFADRITRALHDRAHWVVDGPNTSGYPSPLSVFNEMMNWGLITLYLVDKAPPAERESLQEDLDRVMSERRGFTQSPRFHRFLVELYRNRPPGATVAGLYPGIVEWFEAEARPAP